MKPPLHQSLHITLGFMPEGEDLNCVRSRFPQAKLTVLDVARDRACDWQPDPQGYLIASCNFLNEWDPDAFRITTAHPEFQCGPKRILLDRMEAADALHLLIGWYIKGAHLKHFAARQVTWRNQRDLQQRILHDTEDSFILTPEIPHDAQTRAWICANQLIATTPLLGAPIAPTLLAAAIKDLHLPHVHVLDWVQLGNSAPVVLESNPPWCSGFPGTDLQDILPALSLRSFPNW